MKRLLTSTFALISMAASAQPLMISTNFNSIDFNTDGAIEAKYEAGVSVSGEGSSLQFGVVTAVVAQFGVAALRMSPEELYLALQQNLWVKKG